MLRIARVLGSRLDAHIAPALDDLEHRRAVDVLTVTSADTDRRRMRAQTLGGEELAISLPRDQTLFDGAVLLLEPSRAIVVRVNAERWLRLSPRSISDAVELGYQAGNLRWRVRFAGESLLVALERPADDYIAHLSAMVTERRVVTAVVGDGDAG